MAYQQVPQPTISVEEVYTYDVDVGVQPELTWNAKDSSVTVKTIVPYDDQLIYGSQPLTTTLPPATSAFYLGQFVLLSPEGKPVHDPVEVHLPAGADFVPNILNGQQFIHKWTDPAPRPGQHLVSVEGMIFDGVDSDDGATLRDLLGEDGKLGDFANHLRLRLRLWVPDLFERSRNVQLHQLRTILRERETNQQVFIDRDSLSDPARIGQHIVALTNNPKGGRMVFGIDGNGKSGSLPGTTNSERQTILVQALLQAVVGCTPAVPLGGITYFRDDDRDRSIIAAQVVIPPGPMGPTYRYQGKRYIRRSNATTNVAAWPIFPRRPAPIVGLSVHKLRDVLAHGSTDDVIVLDAKRSIDGLDLGRHICGLINSENKGGLLVIQNLPKDMLSAVAAGGIRRKLNEHLKQELASCKPAPVVSTFWMTRVDNEIVAVLRVEAPLVPIALYNTGDEWQPTAYTWEDRTLQTIELVKLFALYTQRMGYAADATADDSAQMVYAQLGWPSQPPIVQRNDVSAGIYDAQAANANEGRYEVQRQAMVWRKRPFERTPTGSSCRLDASLRSGLIKIDPHGVAATLDPAILTGTIVIRFDNILASGRDVQVQVAEHTSSWFGKMAIKRSTKIVLNVAVRADELFKRRRSMSLSHFFIHETMLDTARVADICEALTDLGFRMTTPNLSQNGASAWITGRRSKGFDDITLFASIQCQRSPLTRHLRYEQRYDIKRMQTAQLDCRIVLRADNQQAVAAIGKLHLAIHQVLKERLHYLHVE